MEALLPAALVLAYTLAVIWPTNQTNEPNEPAEPIERVEPDEPNEPVETQPQEPEINENDWHLQQLKQQYKR